MNRFFRSAIRLLPPLLVPQAWWTAYEGANYSQRRSRVPGVPPQDAKRDLSPAVRRELVRRSRYLHKNSGFVRELVGNMAIYSTGDGIKPQAQSATAIRHAPTLQHSINHILDEMELLALEKHAVKDNADIARVLKTERGELDENGDFSIPSTAPSTEPSDPVELQKIVGGKLLALKPNESIDSFQSNRPSPTFTGFLEHLRRDSALGVLPFEFAADSSKVGGAGVRLIVAKADRRFSYRQLILIQRFVRPVWAYVIGDAIARGELEPVPGWQRISCTTPRRITVDAGREAQQNRADVETGLKTLTDHYSELGSDFGDEIEKRAQDAKLILDTAQKYGVPVEMLWRPEGASSLLTPPQGNNPTVDTPPPA